MTCACATTPDDCCGCCCCEDAVEADSGAGATPAQPAPVVARTGEQLYPVAPKSKETKNKGELLVAVTSKPGLQLKNQGEILVPTTVKPSLVLKNQGVQLSPVVTKGPHAEPVGEYIALGRPLSGMEVVKRGREVLAEAAMTGPSGDDALLLSTIPLSLRRDWPSLSLRASSSATLIAKGSTVNSSMHPDPSSDESTWLSIIPPSLRPVTDAVLAGLSR